MTKTSRAALTAVLAALLLSGCKGDKSTHPEHEQLLVVSLDDNNAPVSVSLDDHAGRPRKREG